MLEVSVLEKYKTADQTTSHVAVRLDEGQAYMTTAGHFTVRLGCGLMGTHQN
jgi:hypothetical protein